jgi:hypothetical protein
MVGKTVILYPQADDRLEVEQAHVWVEMTQGGPRLHFRGRLAET